MKARMKLIAAMLVCLACLASCSGIDDRPGAAGHKYSKVHIMNDKCYMMSSYNYNVSDDGRLYCTLESGEELYMSAGTYFLVVDACPICDRKASA